MEHIRTAVSRLIQLVQEVRQGPTQNTALMITGFCVGMVLKIALLVYILTGWAGTSSPGCPLGPGS